MCYEELSLSGFIKEINEVTTGTHPRKFCFILGAGASRSSGIKSGQDLVKIWDKELRDRNIKDYNAWRERLGITDGNMYGFYSQYYEKRFKRCPSDGYNYIEKIMESAKPSAGYVMLAHMLTQTPHNVVITTNFDHLTEDAVNYYAQGTPLVIGHEFLAHYVSPNPVRPTIIKIHRDLLLDPKSRTEDLEKLPENWKSSLGFIFENYHPIVLGYAGNDKSLMDYLVENAQKFADDEWKYPYWLIYEGDALEGKILEFMSKSRGCTICHAGFDDVMIQLGAAFNYKIPTEDDFLNDAKRRYKALADAIDALSDKVKKAEVEVADDSEGRTIELTEEKRNSEEGSFAIQKIASQSQMQLQYFIAVSLMDKENYEEAGELLIQLIKQDPENLRYHRSYGRVLLQQENFFEALKEFDKAIELDPEDEMSHYLRGTAYEAIENYEEALAEYRTAVELKPEDEINHFKVGNMLEELERYEEALVEYRIAVELKPEDDINHFKVGNMLEELGEYEDALDAYNTANQLKVNSVHYLAIGRLLERLGRNDEAIIQYGSALELDDELDICYWRLAVLYTNMDKHNEALINIKKAIDKDNETGKYYETMALILMNLGKEEEAKEAIEKATLLKEKRES